MNDDQLLGLFVGDEKSGYYLPRWHSQSKTSWNWPAFLFLWFWLGYRKMYSHLFILLGIFICFDIISFYLGSESNPIGITLGVIYGIFGNYFYFNHAKKKISRIKSRHTSELDIETEVIRQGRTSILGIFNAFGLLLLYVLISAFIYINLANS